MSDAATDPVAPEPAAGTIYARLVRAEPWLVGLLLALGAAVRLLWLVRGGRFEAVPSEAHNIAAALVETGRFADAFGPGTGPTAHLAPTTPLLTAGVYAVLGVGTPASVVLLSVLAIAVVLFGFWRVYRIARRCGMPLPARLAALAIVALAPLQFAVEVLDFRSWEGAIAAVIVAAVLNWVLKLDQAAAIGTRTLLLLGLANGVTAVVSLPAGLAVSGMIGVLLLRRVRWTRWPVPVLATLAALALVIVPWSQRNQRELGSPVLLRTGLGISLALTYHDLQLTEDRGTAYNDNFRVVHPHRGAAARAEYMRVGEVAYNKEVGDRANAWRAAHPDVARRIQLENLRDFYFPPVWQFERFGSVAKGKPLRLTIIWGTAAVGLLTIAAMLLRRRWRYLYVAAAVALPCLPYLMTFSLIRYRYLISTLLVFVALDGLARLIGWWRRSQLKPG